MPTLHVRGVPQELYERIKTLAEAEHRSMSAEVLTLLEETTAGTVDRAKSMSAILERIRARRESIRLPKGWPGSTELLRRDRSR